MLGKLAKIILIKWREKVKRLYKTDWGKTCNIKTCNSAESFKGKGKWKKEGMRKEKKEGGERDRKWKMAKSQDNAVEFKN